MEEPKSSSGARYHSVTTFGVMGRKGVPKDLASPKSAIFRIPFPFSSRFDSFRSLIDQKRRTFFSLLFSWD